VEQLYEAIRRGKANLVSPDGEAKPLPDNLYSFLVEVMARLNERKPVYLLQSQAQLTTVEAAEILGVSRQFLINLLSKAEIPYHMVGSHRRIYAQDLFSYKAKRDAHRHRVLRDLAKNEASAGLYDKIPAVLDDD
jgi:excisionase family DNA binding protein